MARIRSIHPGLFTDESFVSASDKARILYLGILTEADDHGVFEWKPVVLKMRLLPADHADVAPLMEELAALNMVKKFSHEGREYGAVRNFCKYQSPKKPNYKHFLPDELRTYVAIRGASSEPVPHQFGTGVEIASQREKEREKEKEKEEDNKQTQTASLAARERTLEPPDPSWQAVRWEIVKIFERSNNPNPIDTSRVDVWQAQGYSPQLVLAVIRDIAPKKPTLRSLNYFDGAIAEAHTKRPQNGAGSVTNEPSTAPIDETTAASMVAIWRRGAWQYTWGPEPNQPGCRIPDEILSRLGIMPDVPEFLQRKAATG